MMLKWIFQSSVAHYENEVVNERYENAWKFLTRVGTERPTFFSETLLKIRLFLGMYKYSTKHTTLFKTKKNCKACA